jgi:hypothetical protein
MNDPGSVSPRPGSPRFRWLSLPQRRDFLVDATAPRPPLLAERLPSCSARLHAGVPAASGSRGVGGHGDRSGSLSQTPRSTFRHRLAALPLLPAGGYHGDMESPRHARWAMSPGHVAPIPGAPRQLHLTFASRLRRLPLTRANADGRRTTTAEADRGGLSGCEEVFASRPKCKARASERRDRSDEWERSERVGNAADRSRGRLIHNR